MTEEVPFHPALISPHDKRAKAYVSYSYDKAMTLDSKRSFPLCGPDEQEKFPEVVKMVEGANFVSYPFNVDRHSCAHKSIQWQWIERWVRESEFFIWDMTDQDPDAGDDLTKYSRTDSSSKAIAHYASGANVPVLIYDPHMATRPVVTSSGKRQHPMLNYLFGATLNTKWEILTDDVATLRRFIRSRDGRSSFDAPAIESGPIHDALVDPRPKLYLSSAWRQDGAPGGTAGVSLDGYSLYPWGCPNHMGLTHVQQRGMIEGWISESKAFVWDTGKMGARTDGSSKFLLHMAYGAGVTCIVIDPEAGTPGRSTPRACENPVHPCLSHMVCKSVGARALGADRPPIYYVRTLADALGLL